MSPRVAWLRAGRSTEPFGASDAPRLSWRTECEAPGWLQAAAEAELTRHDGARETVSLDGPDQVLVAWPFGPLNPDAPATVRVRVTGVDGTASDWSAALTVIAPPADFGRAESFVTVPGDDSDAGRPHEYRLRFALDAAVARATLTLTGHGVHVAYLNDARVGDEWLAPGWTPYERRLLHRSHDVTALLRAGANALGVRVSPGWFGERYGFFGRTARGHHGPLTVIARLDCLLADGRRVVLHSGPGWEGRLGGPVLEGAIYHGEAFDARLEAPGWAGGEDASWVDCEIVAADPGVLDVADAPPIRVTEVRTPVLLTTPSGRTLADFGENCVGVAEITLTGPRGHTVTLRHAEQLEFDEPAYGPLRTARATDQYTLRGDGPETWRPEFTFHGFRYLELIDWPGPVSADDLRLLVLNSDVATTASFTCSDPLVNRLFANTLRSLRGNLVSLPTDCPQRDERLGWTGDLQVFAAAAATLADVDGVLASWLRDLALEQKDAGGSVPIVVPAVLPGHAAPVAGWGDVATVAPWTLYERYGDLGVLADQYDSMASWCEAVLAVADDDLLWTSGMQIGDHLAPTASDFFPGANATDSGLLATAYLARSLGLTARAAETLGREAEAARWSGLAERCTASLLAAYVTPRSLTVSDSVTSYALLIAFGLVDAPTARAMGVRLATLVAEVDFRIATGFLGTPLLMDALTSTGQQETASRLLRQTHCPSWLYPVTMGATTIWERWDTLLPDGRVSAEDMASFNHYALGAVADWLVRGLAGLGPDAPAYRVVRIAPVVLTGFHHAAAAVDTPYGRAAVEWRRDGALVEVAAEVPPNARATVHLPDGSAPFEVGSGRHRWRCPAPPSGEAVPGAVSMDSPLSDLVRDAEARAVIEDRLGAFDPGRAAAVRSSLRWDGRPLHAGLMFAHPQGLAGVEAGLAELTQRRLAGPDEEE